MVEWMKIRKTNIWRLILVLPLVPIAYGIFIYARFVSENYQATNNWLMAWGMANYFYPTIFFPILSVLLAANLCKVEHEGHNWIRALTCPVSWKQLYLSKYLWLVLLLGLAQVIALSEFAVIGEFARLNHPFPWALLIQCLVLGWIGILPLAAFHLAVCAYWSNYVQSVILNILLILPVFLIIGSKKYTWLGYVYPWALPAVGTNQILLRSFHIQVLIIVLMWLILFLIGGISLFIKQKSNH